jgi:Eco57I restriction-modification methylase
MDTSGLKKFAQEARRSLRELVSSKLDLALSADSAARRETPSAVKQLESEIANSSRDQVIEKVAYTWFNRFSALRFMDANGYTGTRVLSPAEGQTRPEILSEAMAGVIGEEVPEGTAIRVRKLLDGDAPSSDPQGEAYRLLVVAICNHWHGLMPFMFEKIADYTELLMPDDLLSASSVVAKMRDVMTEDACQDVEIIGWLYQFYISEKKDQIFAALKKNVKITPENIPAATQLFTPHWIVRYLVENSLGRLWLLNRPQSKLAAKMDYYIAPEEPETDFLRINSPEDIRICDPACGSGHMLTYAFDLLHAIYEEEGYDAAEIPALILTHNLHGVEIDDRAGALAAFALAMKAAAKLGRRRFLLLGVQPNICVLQNVRFTAAEMRDVTAVVGGDLFTSELRETLGQFEQAKNFGSLIVPKLRDPAEVARVVRLKDFGNDLLLREVQARVLAVLRMAEALSPKYHVVVANPPYAGSRGLNGQLKVWLSRNYPSGKADLFSSFIERAINLTVKLGYNALVTMETWMFLSSYEDLRTGLLSKSSIRTMTHMPYLGKGGTSMGISFGTSAYVSSIAAESDMPAEYICVRYYETDANGVPTEFPVENERRGKVSASQFLSIPGSPIAYWISEAALNAFRTGIKLGELSTTRKGLGDQF